MTPFALGCEMRDSLGSFRRIRMRYLLLAATASIALGQTALTYAPPTQAQRLEWAAFNTVGPASLVSGALSSALATHHNHPYEYGRHWRGYWQRQGLRLSGAATSNLMEAELGALWGEDPRYRRSTSSDTGRRLWHATKSSFLAYDRQGRTRPAYARLIAVPSSHVISTTWRPHSQHAPDVTAIRIGLGFVGRIASNTLVEFWPDVRSRITGR